MDKCKRPKIHSPDLKDIRVTRGEKLLIERKRRGEKQIEAARRYETNLSYYCQWETDKSEENPRKSKMRLYGHERCALYRRRAGLMQKELAKKVGLSRYGVNLMENGRLRCRVLVEYWENNGDSKNN